ncbi:YwbE family protein [Ancylomarina sp. 16SWW S1-10-2]|uniref:YwbE family protein n=1 Tax=Ancylomarina sp. 16SWW S1-10-2 TaxID=2499681 RepID=UPI0034CFFC0A
MIMDNTQLSGKNRKDIKIGLEVEIVQKQDQRSGDLTEGIVKRILTKSPKHPHGIKVQLETGEVGRVQNIIDDEY